jgi:hypothetical protein
MSADSVFPFVAKSKSHDEAKLLDYVVNYFFFVKLGMWD